jgi:hypothetical protein
MKRAKKPKKRTHKKKPPVVPNDIAVKEAIKRINKELQRFSNSFVIVCMRKIPPNSQEKYGGAEEIPQWFGGGTIKQVGALAQFAADQIAEDIAKKAMAHAQSRPSENEDSLPVKDEGTSGSPEKKPEDTP